MNIEEDIEAPIYVYYQLENFYQNHRRYVKSKDAKQLAGNDRTVDELSDCAPIITNADLAAPSNTTTFYGSTTLVITQPNAPAIPCGLIAKSVFTDTYTLTDSNNNPITID